MRSVHKNAMRNHEFRLQNGGDLAMNHYDLIVPEKNTVLCDCAGHIRLRDEYLCRIETKNLGRMARSD